MQAINPGHPRLCQVRVQFHPEKRSKLVLFGSRPNRFPNSLLTKADEFEEESE